MVLVEADCVGDSEFIEALIFAHNFLMPFFCLTGAADDGESMAEREMHAKKMLGLSVVRMPVVSTSYHDKKRQSRMTDTRALRTNSNVGWAPKR